MLIALSLAADAPVVRPGDGGNGRCGSGLVVGSTFSAIPLFNADMSPAGEIKVPGNGKLPQPLTVLKCGEELAVVQWDQRRVLVRRTRVAFDLPPTISCVRAKVSAGAPETRMGDSAMGVGDATGTCPGARSGK